MKPLTAMNDSGFDVQKVLQYFAVSDNKKLIVAADDLNTLPGTLMIQSLWFKDSLYVVCSYGCNPKNLL